MVHISCGPCNKKSQKNNDRLVNKNMDREWLSQKHGGMNVAETLKSKSILLKDFIWSYPETFQRRTDAVFKFKPVLVADVFKYLKQLKALFFNS